MRYLAFLALAVAYCGAHPTYFENCGLGPGKDVCGVNGGSDKHPDGTPKCVPLVVRPQEIPKPHLPGLAPAVATAAAAVHPAVSALLQPIGSPCSCQSPIVKPAAVPRPQCRVYYGGHKTQTTTTTTANQQHQHHFGCTRGYVSPLPVVVDQPRQPANPAQYIPADAVSMAIAYRKAQEACRHREDKLSFGFRTLPKEVTQINKKKVNDVAEEKLYKLNGQIIELKPVKCSSHLSVDDEAAEELLNLSEEEKVAPEQVRRVSLGDIGYRPANIKGATFVNVPAAYNPVAAGAGTVGISNAGVAVCNDGFKPGKVEIYQIPKIDTISLPVPLPEPCDTSGELYIPPPPPPVVPPYQYNYHQTSSCTSNHKMNSNVLFQKLLCD